MLCWGGLCAFAVQVAFQSDSIVLEFSMQKGNVFWLEHFTKKCHVKGGF